MAERHTPERTTPDKSSESPNIQPNDQVERATNDPVIGGDPAFGQPPRITDRPLEEKTEHAFQMERSSDEGQKTDSVMEDSVEGHVGERVHLDGKKFKVSSGEYNWSVVSPKGRVVDVMNANKVGPSFVPEEEGTYVAHMDGDDGEVTVNVHVTKSDSE